MTWPPPRESGLFVCIDDTGDELRLHFDPGNKRWHAHRWREIYDHDTGETKWLGPVAFGLTATEWREAGDACRKFTTER